MEFFFIFKKVIEVRNVRGFERLLFEDFMVLEVLELWDDY